MSTRRSGRGFTLLEMILVLAVAALMMGVAASAMLRTESGSARARRGLGALVMHLREARADAMMTREGAGVVLHGAGSGHEPGEMVVAREGGERGDRAVDLGNLGVVDASGVWADEVRVRFDASGRSDARGWRFAERVGSRSGRIVWLIVFDPVSGEARLAEGDGSIADVESWGDRAAELAP